MYQPFMSHGSCLVVVTLTCFSIAAAHTWIEQLTNVAENGTYIAGYGYARSFADRLPNFDQEANLWLLPQGRTFVKTTDLLCHPSQRSAHQSPNFPRLQTSPGNMVAMRYLENGHVTIPGGGAGLRGKPDRGGTVFVFGTQSPREDETLLNVLAWTRDGSGGDRRGLLITAQDYDDGRCWQQGNGAALAIARAERNPNPVVGQPGSTHELSCETDVRLPKDMIIGKPYTLYWIWQWPTRRTLDPPCGDKNVASCPKDQYYTSCVDVDVVVSVRSKQGDNPNKFGDPMTTAVSDFQSRSALTQDPLAIFSDADFQTTTVTKALTPSITLSTSTISVTH